MWVRSQPGLGCHSYRDTVHPIEICLCVTSQIKIKESRTTRAQNIRVFFWFFYHGCIKFWALLAQMCFASLDLSPCKSTIVYSRLLFFPVCLHGNNSVPVCSVFTKIGWKKILVLLKSDQSVWHFTWRNKCHYNPSPRLFSVIVRDYIACEVGGELQQSVSSDAVCTVHHIAMC